MGRLISALISLLKEKRWEFYPINITIPLTVVTVQAPDNNNDKLDCKLMED